MVERLVRDQEAAGSSPVSPTIFYFLLFKNTSIIIFTFVFVLSSAPLIANAEEVETILIEEERLSYETDLRVKESGFIEAIEIPESSAEISIPDTISRSVGVHVTRLGGLGDFAMASIRGASFEQTSVFLDGIPLNTGAWGGYDLSRLTLTGIERAEIYRGYSPNALGGSAIGGAINLITTEEAYAKASARIGAGSFGTREASVSAAWLANSQSPDLHELLKLEQPENICGFRLSAGTLSSDGDFYFMDDRATEFNPNDDRLRKRTNNDLSINTFLANGNCSTFQRKLSLHSTIFATEKEKGLPGRSNNKVLYARLYSKNITAGISANYLPKSRYFVSLQTFLINDNLRFNDKHGEISFGAKKTDDTDNRIEGKLTAGLKKLNIGTASISLDGYYETYLSLYEYPTEFELPQVSRYALEPSIFGEWWIIPDNLALSGATRNIFIKDESGESNQSDIVSYDRNVSSSALTFNLGVRGSPIEGIWLKASGGRAVREPLFSELFGDIGYRIGNPKLEPEKSVFVDGGISFEKKLADWRLFLETDAYYRRVSDLIWWVKYGFFPSKAENIGKARFTGLENRMAAEFHNNFGITANYTYQRPTNESDIPYQVGNDLPFSPRHELFISPRVFDGVVELAYELEASSESYRDNANLYKIPSRVIHSVKTSWIISQYFSLSFSVKNFTDERVTDYEGFPLPGISFYSTLYGKL